jgi:hypothetical protein
MLCVCVRRWKLKDRGSSVADAFQVNPSKENIQHFKKMKKWIHIFLGPFSPAGQCDSVQITLTLHKPAQNMKYKNDLSCSLIDSLCLNIILQVLDFPNTSVIQGAIFLAEEKVHRSQRCKNKQRTVNTEKNTPNRDQLQTSLEHTLFTESPVCRNTHTVL